MITQIYWGSRSYACREGPRSLLVGSEVMQPLCAESSLRYGCPPCFQKEFNRFSSELIKFRIHQGSKCVIA